MIALLQIDTPLYNMAAGLCLGVREHSIEDLANSVLEDAPIIMTVCREKTAAKWDFVKY